MMSQLEAGFMRHIARGKSEILWSSRERKNEDPWSAEET